MYLQDPDMEEEEDLDEDDEIVTEKEKVKCYSFNPKFSRSGDDMECDHCSHYLTLHCPHIKRFIEEGELD